MDIKTIQTLLAQPESTFLEFKSTIDLKNERSKAKFIKEALSLANMQGNPAYLIIGVEDKTKDVLGFSGYTEVDIQNFVRDWCLPPIDFDFHIIDYDGKKLGVMEIFGDNELHRIKRAIHYSDTDGKPREVRENALFIRRGSRVDEATLEEQIAIARQTNPDLPKIISKLDRISEVNEEISGTSYFKDFGPETRDETSREIMETVFVSGLSGFILGVMWKPDAYWLPLAALPIIFFSMIVTSVVRITHFGVRHTIVAGILLGTVLSVWLSYGPQFTAIGDIMQSAPLLGIMLNGLVGSAIGLLAGILFLFWRPLDF